MVQRENLKKQGGGAADKAQQREEKAAALFLDETIRAHEGQRPSRETQKQTERLFIVQ